MCFLPLRSLGVPAGMAPTAGRRTPAAQSPCPIRTTTRRDPLRLPLPTTISTITTTTRPSPRPRSCSSSSLAIHPRPTAIRPPYRPPHSYPPSRLRKAAQGPFPPKEKPTRKNHELYISARPPSASVAGPSSLASQLCHPSFVSFSFRFFSFCFPLFLSVPVFVLRQRVQRSWLRLLPTFTEASI